jgi:Protein of unknown function (DUF3180)
MQPTRPSLLAALVAAAGVAAYLLARLGYGHLPPLPRSWVLTTAVLAALCAALARSVRARLDGRPRTQPIALLVVARCAALARAGSAAAALLGGGYIGFGLFTVGSLEKPAYARDALTCLLGLLAAVALLAAALWLERSCRVRRPPAPPGDLAARE